MPQPYFVAPPGAAAGVSVVTVKPGQGLPVETMTQDVLCTDGADRPAGVVSSSAAS
jgi:hypothetical protein